MNYQTMCLRWDEIVNSRQLGQLNSQEQGDTQRLNIDHDIDHDQDGQDGSDEEEEKEKEEEEEKKEEAAVDYLTYSGESQNEIPTRSQTRLKETRM